MDPRPSGGDPLAAAQAELDGIGALPVPERIEAFGRIHGALAAALAGTAPDSAPRGLGRSGAVGTAADPEPRGLGRPGA